MGLKYDGRQTDAWACGVVLYALGAGVLPFELKQLQSASTESTRSLFLRIAKAEYTWPDDPPPHLASEGLRGIVAKLLVRDSTKRAKMVDLWDEDWMNGEGSPRSRVSSTTQNGESKTPDDPSDHTGVLLDGDTISNIARQD
jgi:serine/threonine protein kinase